MVRSGWLVFFSQLLILCRCLIFFLIFSGKEESGEGTKWKLGNEVAPWYFLFWVAVPLCFFFCQILVLSIPGLTYTENRKLYLTFSFDFLYSISCKEIKSDESLQERRREYWNKEMKIMKGHTAFVSSGLQVDEGCAVPSLCDDDTDLIVAYLGWGSKRLISWFTCMCEKNVVVFLIYFLCRNSYSLFPMVDKQEAKAYAKAIILLWEVRNQKNCSVEVFSFFLLWTHIHCPENYLLCLRYLRRLKMR